MEPQMLMKAAATLFVVAALGGLTMAFMRFGRRGSNPPTWLAMIHGLLAAGGLTLLLYAQYSVGLPGMALLALLLLLVAAAGGAAMNLMFHWKNIALPKPWVIGHGALAAAGLVLLLLAVF